MKCNECGGNIRIKKIPYLYNGQIYLGDYEAEICSKCKSTYFTQDSYKKIEIVAKNRRIWGTKCPNITTVQTAKITPEIPRVDYITLFGDISIKPGMAITAGVL